jgi:hypothetical protein
MQFMKFLGVTLMSESGMAVSEHKIIGPVFTKEMVSCYCYVWSILTSFFGERKDEETQCCYFMQDIATADTAIFLLTALEEVFIQRLVTHGLRLPRYSDLNACSCYLWGTQKDNIHVNGPHSLQASEGNLKVKWLLFQDKLNCVSRNLFRKCVDCLEAGGQHFLISV